MMWERYHALCEMYPVLLALLCARGIAGEWSYDGTTGPDSWSSNPEWMCDGNRQSPINIDTKKLLFDPRLRNLKIGDQKVNGHLQNTGQSLVFQVDNESPNMVNFSEGPLSYNYQLDKISLHYGLDNSIGSEHQIDNHTFPGEIQIYAFNKDLYQNMAEAQNKPHGVLAITLMLQIGEPSKELLLITSAYTKVLYQGSSHHISNLTISSLMPNTQEFLTYEGSLTQPGCWESVVWVIYNKPIYITKQQMYAVRRLKQGTQDAPKDSLGNNFRPVCPLHDRRVRTNIDPRKAGVSSNCMSEYYMDTEWAKREREDLPLISVK